VFTMDDETPEESPLATPRGLRMTPRGVSAYRLDEGSGSVVRRSSLTARYDALDYFTELALESMKPRSCNAKALYFDVSDKDVMVDDESVVPMVEDAAAEPHADDETGKTSFNNLKRVAKELGERVTDEESQEMINEVDLDGSASTHTASLQADLIAASPKIALLAAAVIPESPKVGERMSDEESQEMIDEADLDGSASTHTASPQADLIAVSPKVALLAAAVIPESPKVGERMSDEESQEMIDEADLDGTTFTHTASSQADLIAVSSKVALLAAAVIPESPKVNQKAAVRYEGTPHARRPVYGNKSSTTSCLCFLQPLLAFAKKSMRTS